MNQLVDVFTADTGPFLEGIRQMRLTMDRLNQQRRPQRGDPCGCAKCQGVLHVGNTKPKPDEGVRVQYLECSVCHERPENNKVIIPLEFAPERKKPA